MKTDLLKEAIADADAIKKLAIENAKASLNQAFDSKIKSMLAARLQEEVGDEDGMGDQDENYEETKDSSSPKKHLKSEVKGEESTPSTKDAAEEDDADDQMDEIDINKILAEMEDSEDNHEETPKEMEENMEESSKMEEGSGYNEAKKDEKDEEDAEDEGYGVDEEVDLNELLRELEEGSYDEAKKPKEDAEDEENEEPSKSKSSSKSKSKSPEMLKMEKEHAAEIYEIRKQASRLAQKVNETNLINAKLLYLNKILNKHNLNEAQKVKVISAFDRASTVKEAKIVFESLNEAFVVKTQKSKTNLKESLGLASKAAGNSTKRDIITEADVQVARWQKLAGINKTI
jgi:hypothetical protein